MWAWYRLGGLVKNDFDNITLSRDEKFMDDWAASQIFAWRPVWAVHGTIRPEDPTVLPPRTFNRHVSLHRVSHRQFSKRNTAIATMTATSLYVYLTEGA